MNNIKKVFSMIVFFMLLSCFNNEKNKQEKDKSILNDENINIEKIMSNIQIMPFKSDSLIENYLSEELKKIGSDTIAGIGKDSIIVPRFILQSYGDIFKNNHKYLLVYEQSMMRTSYIWFLKTKNGFIKFYERDSDGIEGALYIKDSIFDTNKDGINELVAYKHRGGSGSDYKIIYFLDKEGMISNEVVKELNEEELNHR